jgi:hypothetical protein
MEESRKRKLSVEGGSTTDSAQREIRPPDSTGIDDTLKHSVVKIFRALKAASGFEGQKLGRRKRQARDEDTKEHLERLQKEEAVLKASRVLSEVSEI